MLLLMSLFVGLLLLGVPIVVTIALSSFATMLTILPVKQAFLIAVQQAFGGVNSFTLIAIPLFILAGILMNQGGIAQKLIKLASVLGGRLPAALLHTNVLGNMLFGAVSGSATAAAVAVGSIISPQAKKEGFNEDFTSCVNIASAPSGLLIPPSNTLILYSVVSGQASVLALFLAGYLPGVIMGLAVMLCIVIFQRYNVPKQSNIELPPFWLTLLDAIPSLSIIIVAVGGILFGVFTASEGAGIAAAYAFVLSLFYSKIKLLDYLKIIKEAAKISGMLMLIIASSSIMSWVLAYERVPELFAQLLLSVSSNKYVILLLMNLCLLFIGTFLDMSPAILIFTPIFLPVATELGLHPVHFGIMLTYNLCIGIITPPVGNCLFVGAAVAKRKVENIMRKILPFYFLLFAGLMLITFIPQISLIFPKLLGAL